MSTDPANKRFSDVVKSADVLLTTNFHVLYDKLDENGQEELVSKLADTVTLLEEFVVAKRPSYWKNRMET